MKKKVLYVGEVSYALSGYGKYARNLLRRLHESGKYEIAEFASYAAINDPRDSDIPWRYYANMVASGDPRETQYKANASNQFGEWRLARVLLDFKPDVVISWRDVWVDKFIQYHPYRKFFRWVFMTTYDSAPSKPEWIETYLNADTVLSYSDWASRCMAAECPKINLGGTASPVADHDIFKPVESKEEHKARMGFDTDSIIVGMVARNQIRKLFPDLFRAFRGYLDECRKRGKESLANRTFLYIHSSYPDLQYWDFPEFLKKFGLGSKVLFTYSCAACHKPSCSFFQDGRAICPHCNQNSAFFPNVSHGVTDYDLAQIYNLFDVYVQYATCEGFGLPCGEALSCGIPNFVVNYSALEDFVNKVGATPIKVAKMWDDIGTGAERAYPDNDDFINKLIEYLSKPKTLRRRREWETAEKYRQEFTWEKTVDIWQNAIDNSPPPLRSWDEPPKYLNTELVPPEGLSDLEFTAWLHRFIGEYEYTHGLLPTGLARDLYYGHSISGRNLGLNAVNREVLYKTYLNIAINKNNHEDMRVNADSLPREDYIDYANLKQSLSR